LTILGAGRFLVFLFSVLENFEKLKSQRGSFQDTLENFQTITIPFKTSPWCFLISCCNNNIGRKRWKELQISLFSFDYKWKTKITAWTKLTTKREISFYWNFVLIRERVTSGSKSARSFPAQVNQFLSGFVILFPFIFFSYISLSISPSFSRLQEIRSKLDTAE